MSRGCTPSVQLGLSCKLALMNVDVPDPIHHVDRAEGTGLHQLYSRRDAEALLFDVLYKVLHGDNRHIAVNDAMHLLLEHVRQGVPDQHLVLGKVRVQRGAVSVEVLEEAGEREVPIGGIALDAAEGPVVVVVLL